MPISLKKLILILSLTITSCGKNDGASQISNSPASDFTRHFRDSSGTKTLQISGTYSPYTIYYADNNLGKSCSALVYLSFSSTEIQEEAQDNQNRFYAIYNLQNKTLIIVKDYYCFIPAGSIFYLSY